MYKLRIILLKLNLNNKKMKDDVLDNDLIKKIQKIEEKYLKKYNNLLRFINLNNTIKFKKCKKIQWIMI